MRHTDTVFPVKQLHHQKDVFMVSCANKWKFSPHLKSVPGSGTLWNFWLSVPCCDGMCLWWRANRSAPQWCHLFLWESFISEVRPKYNACYFPCQLSFFSQSFANTSWQTAKIICTVWSHLRSMLNCGHIVLPSQSGNMWIIYSFNINEVSNHSLFQ